MSFDAASDDSSIEGSGRLRTEELERLYFMLDAEQRDELFQCLLIAAPGRGGATIEVLEQTLVCHATAELLGE